MSSDLSAVEHEAVGLVENAMRAFAESIGKGEANANVYRIFKGVYDMMSGLEGRFSDQDAKKRYLAVMDQSKIYIDQYIHLAPPAPEPN